MWRDGNGTCDVICEHFGFQAEDGIRDAQESRGLGDVYKRQVPDRLKEHSRNSEATDMTSIFQNP